MRSIKSESVLEKDNMKFCVPFDQCCFLNTRARKLVYEFGQLISMLSKKLSVMLL